MNANLQFTLSGKLQRVSTDPRRNLLEVLREDLAKGPFYQFDFPMLNCFIAETTRPGK